MVSIAPFSTKDGLASRAGAGPLTLASLRPYIHEQLLALHEYTDNAAGLDFPGLFTEAMAADADAEYVVRFRLGSTYTASQWLYAQLYLDGALVTSGYWNYGNGLQQSTSAYTLSNTTSSAVNVCAGASANVAWEGELTFPSLFVSQVSSSGARYPMALNNASRVIGYASGAPSFVVSSAGPGTEHVGKRVTGLRLYPSVYGDNSYKIGKTDYTGTLPAFVALYKRSRAL